MEGGPPMFRQDCSCPALLEDCRSGFPYGAVTRYGPPFQTLPVPKSTAAGLVRFRSPLLAESRLMSVPPATEMFQFAGFASRTYEFSAGYPQELPRGWVAPFGDPGINDRSHLPRAFRSVPRPSSPLSAKASTRCPSFALDHKGRRAPPDDPKITRTASRPPENRRAQGQAPPSLERGATPPAAARMKTLPRTAPAHRLDPHRATAPQDNSQCPRPVRLGHIHKSASPFNQHQPRNTSPGPAAPAGAGHARPAANRPYRNQTWSSPSIARSDRAQRTRRSWLCDRRRSMSARVEVNGIEPMTSCLQSRRSPN